MKYLPLALAGLVVACSVTATQVATDAGLISSGLTAAVAAIAATPGVDQTKLATLNADLLTVQKAAAAIAAAPSPTLASEIGTAVDDLAPIAEALVPASSYVVVAVEAAVALVPVLLNEAGAPVVAAATPHVTMSPDMARRVLQEAGAPR